ncbi:hypothetical protein ADUPG1_013156, partial [Aduncisulcus paluster]
VSDSPHFMDSPKADITPSKPLENPLDQPIAVQTTIIKTLGSEISDNNDSTDSVDDSSTSSSSSLPPIPGKNKTQIKHETDKITSPELDNPNKSVIIHPCSIPESPTNQFDSKNGVEKEDSEDSSSNTDDSSEPSIIVHDTLEDSHGLLSHVLFPEKKKLRKRRRKERVKVHEDKCDNLVPSPEHKESAYEEEDESSETESVSDKESTFDEENSVVVHDDKEEEISQGNEEVERESIEEPPKQPITQGIVDDQHPSASAIRPDDIPLSSPLGVDVDRADGRTEHKEEHDREGMPQVGDTPGDDVISEQDNVPSSHDSDSYVGSDSGVSVEHDNVESVERTDVAPAQIELTDKHTVEQGKDTQCGDGMGES